MHARSTGLSPNQRTAGLLVASPQNSTRAASPVVPRAPNHGATLTGDGVPAWPVPIRRTAPSASDAAPTPVFRMPSVPRGPDVPRFDAPVMMPIVPAPTEAIPLA